MILTRYQVLYCHSTVIRNPMAMLCLPRTSALRTIMMEMDTLWLVKKKLLTEQMLLMMPLIKAVWGYSL